MIRFLPAPTVLGEDINITHVGCTLSGVVYKPWAYWYNKVQTQCGFGMEAGISVERAITRLTLRQYTCAIDRGLKCPGNTQSVLCTLRMIAMDAVQMHRPVDTCSDRLQNLSPGIRDPQPCLRPPTTAHAIGVSDCTQDAGHALRLPRTPNYFFFGGLR